MRIRTKSPTGPIVKLGTSRQVVIPRKFHDALGLGPGDLLEVGIEKGKVVLTPTVLIEKRLAEGLADLDHGRRHGPFTSVKDFKRSLKGTRKR